MSNITRTCQFQSSLFGNPVHVSIEIECTYRASICFTMQGTPYTFVVSNWEGRGLRKFLEMFHDGAFDRDDMIFGLMIDKSDMIYQYDMIDFLAHADDVLQNGDGTLTAGKNAKPMTQSQKLNAVEQGCKDIMACLDQIGQVHHDSILDYCVWYAENHQSRTYENEGTYGQFITEITAQRVVQNCFVAPKTSRKLVEFQSA